MTMYYVIDKETARDFNKSNGSIHIYLYTNCFVYFFA